VSLYPTVGKFVADKFLLGVTADLGYRNSKREGFYDSSVRQITYGAVPFARYYIAGADKHQLFGQLNAGMVWLNRKLDSSFEPGGSYTTNYGILGLALGYNYFLTPGAALEATAGYNRNGVDGRSNGTFNIRAGLAIFLPSRQAAVVPTE
jgi:outer membrane protein